MLVRYSAYRGCASAARQQVTPVRHSRCTLCAAARLTNVRMIPRRAIGVMVRVAFSVQAQRHNGSF
jgi:hypothetical protein